MNTEARHGRPALRWLAAGAGFARKQNATDDRIERVTTPKGEYIAVRKHQRGKAAVDG